MHALRRLFRLRGALWRDPDFLKLWFGQSVSRIGTRVTALALPTAAIQLLQADALQVGALAAVQYLPFLVLGVPAGVLVDRLPRRLVMVVCDLGRLVLLAAVPLLYFAGRLSMADLYVVALLVGVFTVFAEVAFQAYLPTLVERSDLVEGNAKFEVSNSVSIVAGPALGGFLIQLFRASSAILVDAASYVVSILTLLWIRHPEVLAASGRPPGNAGPGLWQGFTEGLRTVLGSPTIMLIAASSATANLGAQMVQAVYLLYAYQELHLSAAVVGVVLAVGSLASIAGAMVAFPLARRAGYGPILAVSIFLAFVSYLLLPVARLGLAVPLLVLAGLITNFNLPIYNVNTVTVRQAIVPNELQGRVVGTVRTLVIGVAPVGALLGGLVGSTLGLVPAVVLGAVVGALSAAWILAGPVRIGRDLSAVHP